MLIKRFTVTAALLTMLVGSPASAYVDTGAGCGSNGDDTWCGTTIDDNTGSTSSGSSSGGAQEVCQPPTGPGIPANVDCDGCNYLTLDRRGDEGEHGEPPKNGGLPSPGYKWLVKTCYPSAEMTWREVPVEQAVPLIPARLVAFRASARFTLPRLAPHTSPSTATLVNLPTFFYLDGAEWARATKAARAAIPGTTVTVSATPDRVTWNTGESDLPGGEGSVVCSGPGRPYDAARDEGFVQTAHPEDALRDGRCTTVYRHTSREAEGQPAAYHVVATTTWRITWTCSGTCDQTGGDLPSVRTSAALPLTVLQARAELVAPE
jgi:hypothetical protein